MNEEWLKMAQKLANEYAHCYSFIGDKTMPTAQAALFKHLELAVDEVSDIDALIEQAEADEKAFPLVWWKAWEFKDNEQMGWLKLPYTATIGFGRAQYQRNQHADIIMQVEQDKVDYPEFWWELVQIKEDDWHDVGHGFCKFADGLEYRQHPHRKSIIEWNACSDKDKLQWQVFDIDENQWISCIHECDKASLVPMWLEDSQYRLRPRTCKVTLQDGTVMEYPEPVRGSLENLQEFFYVQALCVCIGQWLINCPSADLLNAGIIHLTKESAEQHIAVLQAVNSQVAL